MPTYKVVREIDSDHREIEVATAIGPHRLVVGPNPDVPSPGFDLAVACDEAVAEVLQVLGSPS